MLRFWSITLFFVLLCSTNVPAQIRVLDGDWLFVPGRLLLPGEFVQATHSVIRVPGYARCDKAGAVGTYQLKLTKIDTVQRSFLLVPEQSSAYCLWADDSLVVCKGNVAKDGDQVQPAMGDTLVSLPRKNPLTLTMQISSHDSQRAGFSAAIKLGSEEALLRSYFANLAMDALAVGALLVLALFHIILFVHRRSLAYISLGLLCLVWGIGFFDGSTNGRLLLQLIPGLSYSLLAKIEMLPVALNAPLVAVYLLDLFPGLIPRTLVRAILGFGVLLSLWIVAVPVCFWGPLIDITQWFNIAILIPGFVLLVQGVVQKRDGAVPIFIGFSLGGIAGVNDILYDLRIVETGYIYQYGVLSMSFCFAFVLSRSYARAFWENKQLNQDLQDRNIQLEDKFRVMEENQELKLTLAKQAEYQRQQTMTRRHLERILDSVFEPLLAYRDNGDILYSNIACLNLLHRNLQANNDLRDWVAPGQPLPAPQKNAQEIQFRQGDGQVFSLQATVNEIALGDESLILCVLTPQSDPATLEILESANREQEREDTLDLIRQAFFLQEQQKNTKISRIVRTIETMATEMRTYLQNQSGKSAKNADFGAKLAQETLALWSSLYPGKGKAELARESGLWAVYMDRDGWERTQTLDRYLNSATFPERPRWSKLFDTVEFVLASPGEASEQREELEILLKKTKKQLGFA